MSDPVRAIILDDDPVFVKVLRQQLESRGVECQSCCDWPSLQSLMRDHPLPDVFLLDYYLGAGDPSGRDVCEMVRSRFDRPVIMLTGNKSRETTLACLRAGAQHYVTKPADPEEIYVRIRAVIRDYWRSRGDSIASESTPSRHLGSAPLPLVVEGGCLRYGARLEPLTEKEEELMRLFISSQDDTPVVARDEAFLILYGREIDPFNRSIDVLVSRLRRKLLKLDKGLCLRTLRGTGYQLAYDTTRLLV